MTCIATFSYDAALWQEISACDPARHVFRGWGGGEGREPPYNQRQGVQMEILQYISETIQQEENQHMDTVQSVYLIFFY